MAGYSGTPLAKKLGIKAGHVMAVIGYSDDYAMLVPDIPSNVIIDPEPKPGADLDLIHLFVKQRSELVRMLPRLMKCIEPAGMIWVSWPKKAAKVATDVTEDVIRESALPLGLVDTKVCAVDAVWSGLRLVIRKELRS